MGVPQFDVNLADRSVIADPFAIYEQIRETGRVVRNDLMNVYMVPNFDDCMEVYSDTAQRFGQVYDATITPWFEAPNMIMVDGPEHTRLRRHLTPFFTRQTTAKWEQRVGDVVDELLAPLLEKDEFDIIAEFTMIPTIVVAEMLGIPKSHYEDFRRWSHTINVNLSYGSEDPNALAAMHTVGVEANDYLSEEIERHRREQPDDLITAMLQIGEMSEAEIRSTAVLLVLAGYDTTAKLLATSLVVLEQHPDERAALVQEPSLIPNAIEEIIRWAGVAHVNPKRVMRDTALGGAELAEGDMLFALQAAANRDPQRWRDPLRFDIRRELKSHIGFGFGAHLCLGAPLARLEVKAALERLLPRAPGYHVRDVDYGTGMSVRGPEAGVVEVNRPSA